MFEEVDELLKSIREKDEIKNYVERNIYPERLKSYTQIKIIPPLNEIYFKEVELEDINPYFTYIKNKLDQIDNLIDFHKENIQNNQKECCPICINEINDTNIIIPSCGHKTCVQCFVHNLANNKYTGNLCSVCRSTIIE